MEYRSYARGSEKISALGMGGEHWVGMPEDKVSSIIHCAMDEGINIVDVFMVEPEVRSVIGRSIMGRRDKIYIQGHLGATIKNGQYFKTRDLQKTRVAFEDLLTRLGTGYIDFGMIHFVDSDKELEEVYHSGTIEYARELKSRGVITRLGFSSHNPVVAAKMVETGDFDIIMFSINAAWDMDSENDDNLEAVYNFKTFSNDSVSISPARAKLYALCAKKGVGITVMKPLGAGRLLKDETSPFGKAMTVGQCLQYNLDRPGVLSNLVGYRSVEEVMEAVKAQALPAGDKDYSSLITSRKFRTNGLCMYCNHCLPCPSGIDIAAVNKYLDLVPAGEEVPPTVKAHYHELDHKADECIFCGKCEERCPFGVQVKQKMTDAIALFGTKSEA